MHDPFPSIWRDRLAALPRFTNLTLTIFPNAEAEDLTCIVCDGGKCEWIVALKSETARTWRGIHEACRRRSEKLRELGEAGK